MSHFYTATGQLIDRVPKKTKPGEYKDTTITEARALNLFPSTTTIIGLLDKPGINVYRVEMAVKAAIADPIAHHELYDPELFKSYVSRIGKASEEHRNRAADEGTLIHKAIADLLCGNIVTPASHGLMAPTIARNVVHWLEYQGFICDKPEHTFVDIKNGYAGTADWVGWWRGIRTVLDIKTQEWTTGDKDRPYFYVPEYPVQLASYSLGMNEHEAQRLSLLVSRIPGVEPQIKNWSVPTEKEPHPNEKWNRVWESLLRLYKELNQWWPEGLHAV